MLQTIQPFFMRSMYSLTTTFLLPMDITHNKNVMNVKEKLWMILGLADEGSFGNDIDLKWLKAPHNPGESHLSYLHRKTKWTKNHFEPSQNKSNFIHKSNMLPTDYTVIQVWLLNCPVHTTVYLTGASWIWSIIRTAVKKYLIEIQDCSSGIITWGVQVSDVINFRKSNLYQNHCANDKHIYIVQWELELYRQ